jgi:excisionase family DNA binding protein
MANCDEVEKTMVSARSGQNFTAFMTTEEVLNCLKVNPRTIYRLIRSGELPAVRIGRQWRFRRSDLDEWIARQQRAAVS